MRHRCIIVMEKAKNLKSYSTLQSLLTTHFEGARSHVAAAAEPHLLHQISVGLGNLAPHS